MLHLDITGATLGKPGAEVTREGWLKARALLTRTGVFTYHLADGTERRELRHPDEVFSAESLKSFEMVPITNGHPSAPLDAATTKLHQIGQVGENVHKDGNFVSARVMITDKAAVDQIMSGVRVQLSCGYTADCEQRSGVFNGERYDSVQKNIRGNHLALVDQARGGPDLRVRLDSVFATTPDVVVGYSYSALDLSPGATTVTKFNIDGVDFEVSESAAQAFEKSQKALNEKLASLTVSVEAAKAEGAQHSARADGLEVELKKANEALSNAPAQVRAEIKARVELEKAAGSVLGADVKLDSMDDLSVKVAVVESLRGEKLDGEKAKNPTYVDAAFDFAMSNRSAFAKAGRQVEASSVKLDEKDSATSARARMIAAYDSKFTKPGNK